MLKHIVLFKVKDDITDKNKVVDALKDKLERLKQQIVQVKKLETGVNISTQQNAYDLGLITEFDNENDLEVYRKHPAHQAVVRYIMEVTSNRIVTDYII